MKKIIKSTIVLLTSFSTILGSFGSIALAATDAPDLTGLQWEKAGRSYVVDGKLTDPGIHVPNWNKPEGNMNEEVVVAVIDTGIDWRHSEFKDKIITFTKEQQTQLGCTKHGYAVDGSLTISTK